MGKVYVTMTDGFMSGWGMAQGKINKLVFECEGYHEAQIVFDNANNRSDMKHVNISNNKPSYNSNKYLTQFKNEEDSPNWYKEGYFKN